MKYALKDVCFGVELVLRDPTIKSVTVFLGSLKDVNYRVRFTRSKKYKPSKVARRTEEEISMTLGRPNYAEREFLKLCKKAKTLPRRYWISKFFKEKKNASR